MDILVHGRGNLQERSIFAGTVLAQIVIVLNQGGGQYIDHDQPVDREVYHLIDKLNQTNIL